jgi:hypothetical protein
VGSAVPLAVASLTLASATATAATAALRSGRSARAFASRSSMVRLTDGGTTSPMTSKLALGLSIPSRTWS